MAESRLPFKISSGSPQQAVAGRSPFSNFLRGGTSPAGMLVPFLRSDVTPTNNSVTTTTLLPANCPPLHGPAAVPFLPATVQVLVP